jgi:uncharacterized membrane protein
MDDIPSLPATYSQIAYVPAGIGIAIARLLKGSIIDMYIARKNNEFNCLYNISIYINEIITI